jgi:hypothetical protein
MTKFSHIKFIDVYDKAQIEFDTESMGICSVNLSTLFNFGSLKVESLFRRFTKVLLL